MRVLYFGWDYTSHDHRFLSALSGAGYEMHYLNLLQGTRQTEDRPVPEHVQQVRWAGAGAAFRWRDLPRLVSDFRRVVRAVKPDLVHAGPIQTCAFIAVLSGFRPVLAMSWGFDLMQDVHRNAWWEFVTRYTLKRASFFISDAQVTRDKALAYGMHPDRTVVFPWGVDVKHFAPGANRQPSTGFTLFCNRSWEPRYGVTVLAKAFVEIARKHPAADLILLGGGSQAQTIRQILMNGGVLERVHFGGQISQADLPNWYHMADLFISPSHVDGSSVSLMEALACGLPVLVSDIPANQEWVREGQNGWLFRDGDVHMLVERVLAVMARKQDLADIGRAARRSAEERADWSKNVKVLFEAYERALKPN